MEPAALSPVARARAEAGLTQAELAEAVDASARTINRIERGGYRPRLPLAARLARRLGLTIEQVRGDEAAA